MLSNLAATLSSVYGLYNGFEICEGTPMPGKEEYLDSEKYELKAWDMDRPGNIKDHIKKLNQIRRSNPALWDFRNTTFLNAWNDNILAYARMTPVTTDFVDYEIACPLIPRAGTCEGATAVRCATLDEGGYRPLRTDCAELGLICGVDETGDLGCVAPPV